MTIVTGLFLIAAISNGSGNPLTMLGFVLFLSPIWPRALAGLLVLHARLDRRAAGRSRRVRGRESKGPRPERLYALTRNTTYLCKNAITTRSTTLCDDISRVRV